MKKKLILSGKISGGAGLLEVYDGGKVYLVLPLTNKVYKLSSSLNVIDSLSINTLPDEAQLKNGRKYDNIGGSSLSLKRPKGTVVKSMDTDSRYLYLLAGYYGRPKFRKVFKVSHNTFGVESIIELPEKAEQIEVDKGGIYTIIGDTSVVMYEREEQRHKSEG